MDAGARTAAQARVFGGILAELRHHWARDRNLPDRLRRLLADRRFGSRDRRLYRELGYTALRYGLWIGPLFDRGQHAAVSACFRLAGMAPPDDDLTVSPEPPPPRTLVPEWFASELSGVWTDDDWTSLLARPPVWVRARGDREFLAADLANEGVQTTPSPVVPTALAAEGDTNITATQAFAAGRFEIQDAGSQRILGEAPAAPGERWLDACAGAGGKTLQLADQVGKAGHVDAWEPRPAAREELATRAERAELRNIGILRAPAATENTYDGVLVDAPCSGSGTWRRSPHLKLCTTLDDVRAAARLQLALLAQYSAHVRVGGRLIYATCSLCRTENEAVVDAFLARDASFSLEDRQTYLPLSHDGDGFFAARLRRR